MFTSDTESGKIESVSDSQSQEKLRVCLTHSISVSVCIGFMGHAHGKHLIQARKRLSM